MSALALRLKSWLPGGRWLVIIPPYVWMLLFFAAPFAIVLKISFAKSQISIPPYSDLLLLRPTPVRPTLRHSSYLIRR